jgi:hypothetical protein
MEAAKQAPISAYAIRQDIAVATIILSTGDAKPIAQTVELLRIDRVYHEASIDQRIDDWSVRHLNGDCNSRCCPSDCEQPVAQLHQTRTTMWKPPLSYDGSLLIENTYLVLFRAPVDANEPRQSLFIHCLTPLTRAVTTPAVPVLALGSATSYWASVVANPSRHTSVSGVSKHGVMLVLPTGRPAQSA